MKNEKLIGLLSIFLTVFAVFISGCVTKQHRQIALQKVVFPCEWIGNIDKEKFNEPSGICFHSRRGTLFVVGDEGDICEIRTDGTLIKKKRIRHADFEGVTHDPASGLLYIAVEGAESIIELNPESFEILREFSIPRRLNEEILLKEGGQGIEAITFVPDTNHTEGGTFFVANQSFSLEHKDGISGIFEVELPLRSKGKQPPKARLLRYFIPGVIDLSGLYYDQARGHLFVISDATNTILKFDKSGNLLNAQAFPGDNQEGITIDENGFMYIAQDSGGIIKIRLKNTQSNM